MKILAVDKRLYASCGREELTTFGIIALDDVSDPGTSTMTNFRLCRRRRL